MIPTKKRRFGFGVMLVAALAVFAAACGNAAPTSSPSGGGGGGSGASAEAATKGAECGSGSLTGSGSTFVQSLALEWIKNYTAQCKEASINYQGVGSGAGIQQLTAGTTQFGATDVPLTSEQTPALDARGPNVQIPWASGGIALEYNLSGVDHLKLDAKTIAEIFSGKITTWDDPAIKSLNQGVNLPSTTITTVHRSDSSGTSAVVSEYLTKAAPAEWTYGTNKTWPGPGGQGAKGSDGVTATVAQTQGTIGYAETSFAVGAGLHVVEVENAAGKFTTSEQPSAVSATLKDSTVDPTTGVMTINFTTKDPAAYPIATATYVVAMKSQTSPLLKHFFNYAVTNGQASAEKLFYVPLPENIVNTSKHIISTMT